MDLHISSPTYSGDGAVVEAAPLGYVGPDPELLREALRRAGEAAGGVEVAGPEPWRFYSLGPRTTSALIWLWARKVEGEAGAEAARAAYDQWRSIPGWVLVTSIRRTNEDEMATSKERSLTAAQRFALSLWSEGIRTSWITEALDDNDDELYETLRIDRQAEVILGVLWYGHAEGPASEDKSIARGLYERP
ncbi:hypothetical protein BH23ACT11_BH23ACT11_15400 [soil metagenome]